MGIRECAAISCGGCGHRSPASKMNCLRELRAQLSELEALITEKDLKELREDLTTMIQLFMLNVDANLEEIKTNKNLVVRGSITVKDC